jgi:hypothetical protein
MSKGKLSSESPEEDGIRQTKRPPRIVSCRCPKCLRLFDQGHIPGMRRWPDGPYRAWCANCHLIYAQVKRRSGKDLPTQLFLSLYPTNG